MVVKCFQHDSFWILPKTGVWIEKMKSRKSLAFFHLVAYNIDIKKAPTPKVDASMNDFSALMSTAHPVCRQDGHFYFRLFLLSRKAINATMKPPKDMSKPNIPIITIMVS